MPRLHGCRHLIPVAIVVALSLVVPLFAFGGTSHGPVRATASVDGAGDLTGRPVDQAFPSDGPAFAKARDVAVGHWGAQACSGQVTLAYATLDDGTNATASWSNPTDAWNNAAANFDCQIEISVRADFDFPKLCTVLAHEFGHLLGQQHASGSGELMSPMYSTPLPECVSADPNPPQPAAAAQDSTAGQGAVAASKTTKKTTAAQKKTTSTTSTSASKAKKRCYQRYSRKSRKLKSCVAKAARAAKRTTLRARQSHS